MFLRIVLFLILICTQVYAKHLHPEKYYQNLWCKEQKGTTEVKLIDDTRIDCLTKTHAIEFDFASKWAEAIGQSLHYARMSGKNAGIVLIIENKNDYKYYNKIKPLCDEYKITLWQMTPPKNPQVIRSCDIGDIIELIIKIIKEIIKLFSDFQ